MSCPSLYASLLYTVALSSCAALDTERNLAPLYSEHWTAGGGVGIEALGGSILTHRPSVEAELDTWAMRPLFIHEWKEGLSRTEFLSPLGTVTRTKQEFTWAILPFARYSRQREKGFNDEYSLLILPLGLYFAQFRIPKDEKKTRSVRASFPFIGVTDRFLTFDKLEFFLFPLYVRTERGKDSEGQGGRTTWHWLFPIFSYSESDDGIAWRAWPLIGHDTREERYDRWFFLWPIFQLQRNEQRLGPENEELTWAVFPFFGRTTRGSFHSTTVLWPFFGYSENKKNGFRSLDFPWPLVNIQEPGTSGRARRFRIWPIYSKYEGDGMVSRSWAWPFIHHRVEIYPDGERTAFSILPFYQSLERRYEGVDEPTRWQKLWPLWQHEEGPDLVRSAFPALNPLWRTPNIDRHYAWLWELYTMEKEGTLTHQRSWLGLWRRESDEYEIRTSLSGLWSRRTYRLNGALTHENSLLFGLIRWSSTESEGTDLLSPAMPGPGWPLRPSTELLEPPMSSLAPLAPEPLG